ncbi:MAG: hypothetical protein ACOYU2_06000 [Nitrospirota bacterium]
MMRFLKVLGLVVVVVIVSGCGAHYVLDGYIDQSQIVSSNDSDAIKVYVGEYRFNDEPGHKFRIGHRSAEGEISPWIKQAIKKEFGKVNFVDDKAHSDVAIETKRVEFNAGWNGIHTRITSNVNNKMFIVDLYARRPIKFTFNLSDSREIYILRMERTTEFMAKLLKQHIVKRNGAWIVDELPYEVRATILVDHDLNVLEEPYDIEVKKAED